MRVVALVATFNEARFIGACIGHYARHGVGVHLLDNQSTDDTIEVAERYRGRGLVGLESFPRDGVFPLRRLLERKGELAGTLDADWFLHADADEVRLPPGRGQTLAEALSAADRAGSNAVNFQEFTFVPTRESPDHDHPSYERTMRWYYAFAPRFPHQLKAWKRQDGPIELASSAGHLVTFPGRRIYPESFPMRHYQFLSVDHAIRKYVEREFNADDVALGWHGARATLRPEDISLVSEHDLHRYVADDRLDASSPRTEHALFANVRSSPPSRVSHGVAP